MSEYLLDVDVSAWVEESHNNPLVYQQRQTIEIVLNTIAMTDHLNRKMFLKGGILMGLAYSSPRQTVDIDLTTTLETTSQIHENLREKLDHGFLKATAILGYPDMIVQIHSIKEYSRKMTILTATFPALKLKITSAKRNTHQEITLKRGKPTNIIIEMDVSFNEPLLEQSQIIKLTDGHELLAYGLVDLVAEKYRAILQQIPRRRRRPQDIYDLNRLIQHEMIDADNHSRILDAIKEKSRARGIEPKQDSLDDPEIKYRCKAGWQSLKLELDDVPEFETCFANTVAFYHNLPW